MSLLDRILGPKVSRDEASENPARYWTPKMLFTISALLLIVSILLPYWVLDLAAPQYPDGLTVTAFVNRLEGDVQELENLNHYIGLPSFEDGAQLERTVSIAGIIALAGLLLAGLYIRTRWVLLFAIPAVLFPLVFLADLQFWLWRYGHDLDPRAPLANSIGEFTPKIFGSSKIGNFTTDARPAIGLVIAVVAALVAMAGLWFHRRAYKPLIDELALETAAGHLDAADPATT